LENFLKVWSQREGIVRADQIEIFSLASKDNGIDGANIPVGGIHGHDMPDDVVEKFLDGGCRRVHDSLVPMWCVVGTE
jgi:hypothetical protein